MGYTKQAIDIGDGHVAIVEATYPIEQLRAAQKAIGECDSHRDALLSMIDQFGLRLGLAEELLDVADRWDGKTVDLAAIAKVAASGEEG